MRHGPADRPTACRRTVGAGLALATAFAGGALSAVTAPAAQAVAPPSLQAGADPRPVAPEVYNITVPAVEPARVGPGSRVLVAELTQRSTRGFELVGVTWQHATAGDGVEVQIRVRAGGTWTAWQELHHEPHEGPAPGEEAAVRDGTEPMWVGSADGVQARVTTADGSVPRDIRVVAIDPGSSPYDAAVAANTQIYAPSERMTPARAEALAAARGTLTKKPYIFNRQQWGADPSMEGPCPGVATTVKVVFVHHTAGSNKYPERDSAAIVRSIYAYHTQGRGWCDIGYNFLVDRYGNIFEGRRGGVRKPVHGAHVGNYNGNSVGIGMMGDFSSVTPPRKMRHGLARLTAWRMGSSYKYARGTAYIYGHPFKHISGHRDAMQTSCPGQVVYDWLPRLRGNVVRRIGDFRTPIYWKWKALGGRKGELGAPFEGEQWQNGGRYTVFDRGRVYWSSDTDAHALTGPIMHKFRKFGGVGSRLHFPVTDVWPAKAPGALRASFEGGRIYWSERTRAQVMYGRILHRWVREGEAGGRLGLPRTPVFQIEIGRRQKFQHGNITFDARRDRTFVVYRP